MPYPVADMVLTELKPEDERCVRQAAKILQEAGCQEVYLFGSMVRQHATAISDLDLAVRGCPRGRFFQLLGTLMVELDRPVDLVNLDISDPFTEHLEMLGGLRRVV